MTKNSIQRRKRAGQFTSMALGYHIIRLTGRRAAGLRPFDEIKEEIRAALIPSRQQSAFRKIKEDLKKDASVALKEDVLKTLGSSVNWLQRRFRRKEIPESMTHLRAYVVSDRRRLLLAE